MEPVELSFESRVGASPVQAWEQATSLRGISREMMPFLRMTAPEGVERLSDLEGALGRPLFGSWLLLFGLIPIGRMRLTLVALEDGARFVEQSPMTGMRLWRHERRILPDQDGCIVVDRLTFEPAWGRGLVSRLVRLFFDHRHAVLRQRLGG